MPASALAGLTLLVLGESHMSLADHLMEPLNADLTRQGAIVHSIGACGASAGDWLITKKVDCGAEQKGTAKIEIKGRDATTTPIAELIAKDKPTWSYWSSAIPWRPTTNRRFPRPGPGRA